MTRLDPGLDGALNGAPDDTFNVTSKCLGGAGKILGRTNSQPARQPRDNFSEIRRKGGGRNRSHLPEAIPLKSNL
jgi:hypothetical protein